NGAGPFTNLWPRQPITSTPYAIRAANFSGPVAASQLTGTISSNNIGAGTIHSAMLAAGAVTTTALADGAVTAAKLGTVTVPVSLITITNPTPAASDFFGSSVAMVGTDRVLIGAPLDDTAGGDAGAAYLFNASGSLLVALTN